MPGPKPTRSRAKGPAKPPGGKAVTNPAPAAHAASNAGFSPQSPSSAVSAAEQNLVTGAYRKLMSGQGTALTRAEREAVKRHEKEKEERLRWQYYAAIPQKHWRQMSGRQTKVLNEQAERYGIPFGGPAINLSVVVRSLHDFLAANAVKLARDDDPMMSGAGNSPALERYREERAALARLDRLERERELLPREKVRQSLGRVAALLRGAGEALTRQFGTGAGEVLHEALDDVDREIERSFGESSEPDDALAENQLTDPDNSDDPNQA